ncbi:hypothetical protein C8Q77DRAFT_1052012 [Trametes polyzona]|nr:hypothetical protein C8Q77DRAFT_1052012 [Trametes polyzona]
METPIFLLNDDVLLLILADFYGEDALNVALTSKRLYHLAAPRVAARAFCWKPEMITQLCDYMLTPLDSRPRARYLQILVLHSVAFVKSEDGDEVSASDTARLSTLLSEAHSLRTLRWGKAFLECFVHDPHLGLALSSLKSVTVLELRTVNAEIVSLLASMVTLEVLQLWRNSVGPPEQNSLLQALIMALSNLRRLHTLSLWNLQADASPVATSARPRFSSIKKLSLCGCPAQYFTLLSFCPNISHLEVLFYPTAERGAFMASRGNAWPPLDRLTISLRDFEPQGFENLNRVHWLDIRDEPFESPVTARALSLALPKLRPVSVSASARFRENDSPAWKALSGYERGLRMLDVAVTPHAYRPWSDNWHSNVPAALAGIPLLSLRFMIHSVVSNSWKSRLEAGGMLSVYRRKEALSSIPPGIFEALPTLRIVAIAERSEPMSWQSPNSTTKAHHRYMNDGIDPMATQGHDVSWDSLDRTRYQFHWWCRAPSDGAPVRIAEKDGERIYRAVERACKSADRSTTSDTTAEIERESLQLILIPSTSAYATLGVELISTLSL